MSLLKVVANLFDEQSDYSLDNVLKKLDQKLENVEKNLGTSVDRLEDGVKKLDYASQKTVRVSEIASSAVDKLDDENRAEQSNKE